jgi:hypothetical protein
MRSIAAMTPAEKESVRAELERSLLKPRKTPAGDWIN